MEIAERFGGVSHKIRLDVLCCSLINTVDPDQACENITYARAQNSEVGLDKDPVYLRKY
jgi:hypothetical protein